MIAPNASRRLMHAAIGLTVAAMVSACAGPDPALTRTEPYDPYEQSNRKNHKRIVALDQNVLRPVSRGYSAAVPDPVETAISNFASNLSLPGAVVNNALQGNAAGVTTDTYRFLVNSTVGIGGLIDVATLWNMPAKTDADFGQTLYAWGVHEGPYVELPLIRGNTSRALAGRVVDRFTNPLSYFIEDPEIYYTSGTRVSSGLTARARYDDAIQSVLAGSADSYAASRDYYLQNRRYKVRGGGSDRYSDPYDVTAGAPKAPARAVSADLEDPYDQ